MARARLVLVLYTCRIHSMERGGGFYNEGKKEEEDEATVLYDMGSSYVGIKLYFLMEIGLFFPSFSCPFRNLDGCNVIGLSFMLMELFAVKFLRL